MSVALHLVPENAIGPTGVGEHGQWPSGFPRNLGDPDVSTAFSGSGTGSTTPRSPRSRVGDRREQISDATVVSPSEGNEARRDGRRGVGVSHRIGEAGEQALLDPAEKRGDRVVGATSGTTPRASYLVRESTPGCRHRLEGRDHDVTSRMREIRTSGSVGARGEQSPWATRPVYP